MAERPILFQSNMVRAVLDGRKTQTRRLATNKVVARIQPGDTLWVREAFSHDWLFRKTRIAQRDKTTPTWYWADGSPPCGDWESPRPSIHMPRWASRISLFVTDVESEFLQDISSYDAKAEGCGSIADFGALWRQINGEESWAENPLVIAISFQVVRAA